MNSILRFVKSGSISSSTSSRLRQLTATHGFDGTKWNFGVFETTVTTSALPAFARIS